MKTTSVGAVYGRRVLCFSLITILAISCGAAPTPPPTPTPAEKVVLRVYTYNQPPMNQVLDIASKSFTTLHPDITVQIENITGDPAQQIASLVKSGTGPDVVWTIDAMTPSLVDAGVLLDMSEMANIDTTFKRDDINPRALNSGNIEGDPGLYMIPASMESVQMFYNKDLFKKAGAPLPTSKWTWDDLIAACKQIQDTQVNVKCLGYSNVIMPDPGWWAYIVPWILGYGGDVLSKDGKMSTLSSFESLTGIQAYADLWIKDKVASEPNQRGFCFIAQRCAVMFYVYAGIGSMQERIGNTFDWDVETMPAFPKGHFTGTAVYGFGISKSSTHPDLAWEFVKRLASPDVQQALAKNRVGLPVLKSLENAATLRRTDAAPANVQAFIQGADFGVTPRSYPTACGNFYNGLVQTAINEAFKEVLDGGKVESAFKKADDKIQSCMDAAK